MSKYLMSPDLDGNKWSYQKKAAALLVRHCENRKYIGAVLAGAVSCGKSNILVHALNIICKKNKSAKILFLTYCQTNLKEQMIGQLVGASSDFKPIFSFGKLEDENVQVTLAIPQEFETKYNKHFDYLVIDEAHQWFASKSVLDNIIAKYRIRKLILATGTPSFFNKFNKNTPGRKFMITYIAGDEMLKRGIYCPLDLDLIRVSNYDDTDKILELAWQKAEANLDCTERPIIVCENSEQAEQASDFLKKKKYTVSLATSHEDPKNKEIKKFQEDHSSALVVINRGILGLNIPIATIMICLKKTSNIDLLLQIIARMYRCHPNKIKKAFFMPATPQDWNKKLRLLQKVLSLNKLEIMKSYCG